MSGFGYIWQIEKIRKDESNRITTISLHFGEDNICQFRSFNDELVCQGRSSKSMSDAVMKCKREWESILDHTT